MTNTGPWQEIYTTMRLSQISRKILTHEQKLVNSLQFLMVEQDTDLTGRVDREQGGGVYARRRGQVDDRPSPPLHHSWHYYTGHLQSASILL